MLADQTAVVTGGSSGIGRGICLTLADHGADVIVADVQRQPRRDGPPTTQVIETETDATAEFVECNVADPTDVQTAVLAAEEIGGIDIMVNNAAIARASDRDSDSQEVNRLLGVNLAGVFYGTRIAGEAMAANGGGSIINVGSTEGVHAVAQRPLYSASKGAIPLLTDAFAGYFGPEGVRVNTVHPGLVDTEMVSTDIPLVDSKWESAIVSDTPLRRLGEAEEIGNVVSFLASEMASFVTGAEIVADGGHSASM